MGLVKVVKNKAYFMRFQVKNRRRREGKTDFQARRALIIQDKNKYNAHKYRFVVRISSRDVCCQVTYATVKGDVILTSAYSHELPRYGIKYGLTNYAAAYATGLLCARRVLQKLGLDKVYAGKTEADGEMFEIEEIDDGPRPFKCFLDAGLVRTTTGHRIFAAMKGAVDGGIDVPHNEKRLVGYSKESKEFDAEVLRKYIFGGHVAEYMRSLKEEDEEKYTQQFSQYAAAKINADNIEQVYKNAHKAIRADPSFKAKKPANLEQIIAESKKHRVAKRNLKQRKDRIRQKKEAFLNAQSASA